EIDEVHRYGRGLVALQDCHELAALHCALDLVGEDARESEASESAIDSSFCSIDRESRVYERRVPISKHTRVGAHEARETDALMRTEVIRRLRCAVLLEIRGRCTHNAANLAEPNGD